MRIPYDQRNKCPITTHNGDECGQPVSAYHERQQLTCIDHQADNPGRGSMLCGLCDLPQRNHKLGFPEHTHVIAHLRSDQNAIHNKL